MKTYVVNTERSGNWWAFSIPEIPGAHGQAKRLDLVKNEARDVVALMLDAPEESFDLELAVKLDARMEHILDEARTARQQFESSQRIAQEKLRAAAEQFKDVAGLGVRDIGSLLNVSFQRISQILGDKRNVS
jgi:hypothetical protein